MHKSPARSKSLATPLESSRRAQLATSLSQPVLQSLAPLALIALSKPAAISASLYQEHNASSPQAKSLSAMVTTVVEVATRSTAVELAWTAMPVLHRERGPLISPSLVFKHM